MPEPVPPAMKGERRFSPGALTITGAAQDVLRGARVSAESLLSRHYVGDWGEIPEMDKFNNDKNLESGGRVISVFIVYRFPVGLGKEHIWICSSIRESWTYVCLKGEIDNVL
jgi:hypothetical protein